VAAGTFSKFDTIKLEKSIPEDSMAITDEKLLSQVIINLLKNACEALIFHNAENPKIILRLRQSNNTTRIEITNNGPHIPPEIREQIFVPFFTTKEDGSGVGLSLSKQIMLKMNGDVLLNSMKEKSTTFTVILN
jgi:signal transduction histidine kinase